MSGCLPTRFIAIRLASHRTMTCVTAASRLAPLAPSRAKVARPVRKLSKTVASACVSMSVLSSPVETPRRTQAAMPALVLARDSSSGWATATLAGEGALIN